jgi:hypothetical protein
MSRRSQQQALPATLGKKPRQQQKRRENLDNRFCSSTAGIIGDYRGIRQIRVWQATMAAGLRRRQINFLAVEGEDPKR